MNKVCIAIAGDLHGSWSCEDLRLLRLLNPDAVLFVGDLSEGQVKIANSLKQIPFPTAVILGNHDRGKDLSGDLLKHQISVLGDLHCPWSLRKWDEPKISVVGARPCSSGGGFRISGSVRAVYGDVSLPESVQRIVSASKQAPDDRPLVLLAHSGPVGLGSDSNSICGRDWKLPSLDWGDQDLGLAINQIRKDRLPDLVVFGHMHHSLYRGGGFRQTFQRDIWGTSYLNAACVPRRGYDEMNQEICHFSWVEFLDNKLNFVAHRWYRNDGSIAYEDILFTFK